MSAPSGPRTVLHVISSLGQLGGGAERQLLLYLQHRTDQWRHVVAYVKRRELLRPAIEATGVRAVWLGGGPFIAQLARLVRLAREESADLVHTHLFEGNLHGRLAGAIVRAPVVTTLANTMEPEDRVASGAYASPWKYRLSLGIERLTARLTASSFIAISDAVRQSAIRNLGVAPSRIRVVYRAVRNGPVPPGRTRADGPVLITTGRLVPVKGQELLIRMFPKVLAQWPKSTLVIVGDGPARTSLERLAADLGIGSQVQLPGLCEDVRERLAQADLYVYASWFEGFANAMAEAVAGGLPVVAVDLPVFREIVPPASGTLVPRDPDTFAQAVLDALAVLPDRRAAALREGELFRERFSIARYVRETEAMYEESAPRAAAPGPHSAPAAGTG